ncbi:MAG: hypothetical protein WBM08_08705 [Prochlorococcaceae cyanobacterium]
MADLMEHIQSLVMAGETRALFVEPGLIACGESAYLRRYRDNAFWQRGRALEREAGDRLV